MGIYRHVCGCYFIDPDQRRSSQRIYLPQVKLDAHTTILSTASRTVLKQTFVNTSKEKALDEIRYTFPLFDGVSIVDFACRIGSRTIYGLVKEKGEARQTYQEAKKRGEKAALLEELPDAADVFTTSVSNIPAGETINVTITYVQELKHDAEVDGVRLTVPTLVAPRYGYYPGDLMDASPVNISGGISLTVDVSMNGAPIKKILSPSHTIEVSLGSLSTSSADDEASMSKASATLALGTTELEKDFVLQTVAKDVGVPQAILETHPTLPNQRALMTTLVPKFNLKSQKPEIIFIADRSGSMDSNIPTLISALKIFLKSIPIGCMFNICSFGNSPKLLWDKSQVYDQRTLAEATRHVESFDADLGGTETLKAVQACIEARHKGMSTELMLLTDGDFWAQQQIFEYVSEETKSGDVRVFPIGIGNAVSSALIEGIARAGRGFAQMVAKNEKMDQKIVRMLKGALTPHIMDYRLEVKYQDDSVDSVADSLNLRRRFDDIETEQAKHPDSEVKPISLYDPEAKEEHPKENEWKNIFAGLPELSRPKILQAPHEMPALYPFNRSCVYLLLSPETSHLKPKTVILKGTSPQGPLQLEIPVEIRKEPDQIIHQLAARKATEELEEGRGWVSDLRLDSGDGGMMKEKRPGQFSLLQRREAVRLGIEFQVGGRYCSFVAVEANEGEIAEKRKKALQASMDGETTVDDGDLEDLYQPGTSHGSAKSDGGQSEDDFYVVVKSAKKRSTNSGFAYRMINSDGSSSPGTNPQTPDTPGYINRSRSYIPKVSTAGRPNTGGNSPRKILANSPMRASRPSSAVSSTTVSAKNDDHNDDQEDSDTSPQHQPKRRKRFADNFINVEASVDEEECEESDDDMAFGLFDGPSLSQTQTVTSIPQPEPGFVPELKETGTLLQRLIALQAFDGSWPNIENLPYGDMGVKKDDVRAVIKKIKKYGGGESVLEVFVCTVLVVMFLEKKMSDEQETWELVVDKARDFIEGLDADIGGNLLQESWYCLEKVL
ncbi:hypothetical protein P280DRAFT_515387 [Massarina eburnea CBS 473.64]|uniref:VIT-domain-containing protein n=1 Tax=Massarina eburnea CBS 473.64 TaxID=1395130 RepID=A0A6A6S884_9PLEO|nr:hypothetical protein P280DRAFT_515387 [Massarina eburnea CBS 473.64]